MLLVLRPLTLINNTTMRSHLACTIALVVLPLALVAVKLATEVVPVAVAPIVSPVPHVQILVVIIAMAVSLAQIFPPLSMVLVIAALFGVAAAENSAAVFHLISLYEHLPFIEIAIAVYFARPGTLKVDLLGLLIEITHVS
mmetsp:Transcript_21283/g.28515  ORF Transcript_21283/g.28515 Transcript_21283/m.28515 type:complete len:141 (+) Transcript_21283:1865-2287(+)